MVHLITELSRYTMIILFALYTWQCFSALKRNVDAEEQKENMPDWGRL